VRVRFIPAPRVRLFVTLRVPEEQAPYINMLLILRSKKKYLSSKTKISRSVEMTFSADAKEASEIELTTKQKMYFDYYVERIIKTNLEIVILCILRDNPMCGYDVIKSIFEKYSIFLSQGTVYPLLYSLKDQGILKAEFDRGNMRSKIYSISEEGEEIAKDRLNEFIRAGESVFGSINSSDGKGIPLRSQ
jgi:DNA-binding PadR family transcriptional regulator